MNDETITVVVPFYNDAKYLAKCIESVIKQTYTNWRLLLVDDSSTDESPAICKFYAARDKRIKYFRFPHRGISANRNSALGLVDTSLFTFLDGDDQFESIFLATLYQRLQETDSDIAVGYVHGYNSDHDYYYDFGSKNIDKVTIKPWYTPKEWFGEFFPHIRQVFWTPCVKLFRTRVFDHVRFPEDQVVDDVYTMWKPYFNAKRITFVNANLYQFEVHLDSQSRSSATTVAHPYEYIEPVISLLSILGIPIHYFADQYLNDVMNTNRDALPQNNLFADQDTKFKQPLLLKQLHWTPISDLKTNDEQSSSRPTTSNGD